MYTTLKNTNTEKTLVQDNLHNFPKKKFYNIICF